jgi:hypothetical protein
MVLDRRACVRNGGVRLMCCWERFIEIWTAGHPSDEEDGEKQCQ